MNTRVRPARLGKYVVIGELGEGAMGVVFKALDPGIDRTVAIKTIRRELVSTEAGREMTVRFRREAMAAGRLSHPGIVTVFDYGEDGNTAYIVMEYAPGYDLSTHVLRRGRLEVAEIGSLLRQLLEALAYTHAHGVVHRDIKPSNLLVSEAGTLKITDFGVARIDALPMTRTGATVGTPAYMAPEIYRGETYDHRADLFSAGVVLYELLTGCVPFDGETVAAIAYQVCHSPHTPPSHWRRRLPRGLDRVIDRALTKQAETRYENAQSFAKELATAVAEYEPGSGDDESVSVEVAMTPLPMDAPPKGETTWSKEVLLEVESALASVLGPIAGVVVRRSVARAASPGRLAELLCESGATPDERERIAAAIASVIGPVPSSDSPSILETEPSTLPIVRAVVQAGPPSAPKPAARRPIARDDIERLTNALAIHVGPIARVLVKRALTVSIDVPDLRQRLAEHITDEGERHRWLESRDKS